MLNIFKLRKKNKINVKKPLDYSLEINRYYPPAIQEWKDSVYKFNKNTNKIIPIANNFIFNLLKSYFQMYSRKMERKIKFPRIRKWRRRLLGRKIWISKPELKYFNDKIIINIYIYNRQYKFLLKKMFKLKYVWHKILVKNIYKKNITNNFIIKNLKNNNFFFEKKIRKYFNKEYKLKYNLINLFRYKYKKILNKVNKYLIKLSILTNIKSKQDIKNKFTKIFNKTIFENNKLKIKIIKYILYKSYIKFLKKILKHQILILRYRQNLLLNRLKFNNLHLLSIKFFLQRVLKKNIQFNLITLKRFNLSGDILSQIITTNIRNRENKPLKVIKASVRKTRVYNFNKHLLRYEGISYLKKKNQIIYNIINNNNKYNEYLELILFNKLYKDNKINFILNSTSNKTIAGIRVQASGRITRRIIAQRATCKIRYKGTLKNIDSSYRRISNVLLKGYEKSTLQYTHLASIRKIGAFGLKGWINTY